MEVDQLAGETTVARRLVLQGQMDVKDCSRRIVDTSGQQYSAGRKPGLFLQDGHMWKLQGICLGWVGDEKLPVGWTRQRRREVDREGSGCGAQLQGYSQNRRVHQRLVNKI